MSELTGTTAPDLRIGRSRPSLRRSSTPATARTAFLARVGRSLSGALHTDRAVDLLLEMLVEEVADWAQVALRGHKELSLRNRVADGNVAAVTVPAAAVPADGVLGRVLATGATDLVPVHDGSRDAAVLVSVAPDPRIRASLQAIRPMDVLTVALAARGSTYGALTLARRAGDGFDADTVTFVEELADQISVTLDTTRALAESRRVATVLSRDLNPPSLPDLEGVELASYYRVAFEQEALGGDFYDVHGDDADWTAVVGDVCGKGVDAAVLTGRVRQSVRTAALVDRSPAAVLDLVNRVLLADSQETFVTAVCVRGRRVDGLLRLDLAAAGHPAPWLVRRDGSAEQVAVGGVVLGLLDDGDYTDVSVDLAPGDTLVLYTDGVLEAPGRRERFGDQRLRRVLESGCPADASAIVEGIAVALSAHLGDRPHDDIAILAIQPGTGG